MRLSIWILLSLCLVGSPALAKETARQANTRGYRLYQAKQYPKALKAFQAAVAADPSHALAHYNLAATLGVLRKQGKVCDYEAYRSTIVEHLTKAVELDPGRKERMQKDADFDPVRDTVGYVKLLGHNLESSDPKDLQPFLVDVSWYGPSIGAFGSLLVLDFQQGGTLKLTEKYLPTEESTKLESRTFAGKYEIQGRKITLRLDSAYKNQTVIEGELSSSGALAFPDPPGTFRDEPSDCSA